MSRPAVRFLPLAGLALASLALLSGCGGGESDAGSRMAERSLRIGEDDSANALVYEAELPPALRDLLNPDRDADTPSEDLVAFPVHPDGVLVGSWLLRRADGAQTVRLFYDVAEAVPAQVADTVAQQLGARPWQIVLHHENRAFTRFEFESTGRADASGFVFVTPEPPDGTYELVVERDGSEMTLDIPRAATLPVVEADIRGNLRVQEVYPGTARTAGLREADRILRVGDTVVTSTRELQEALDAMARATRGVALTYILQFPPPLGFADPEFIPYDMELPEELPGGAVFRSLMLEEYQSESGPEGVTHLALFVSEEREARVVASLRDGLEAGGWEITSDEAVGLATLLTFEHAGDGLSGAAQIDTFTLDDSLTQVFVQIQSTASAGN